MVVRDASGKQSTPQWLGNRHDRVKSLEGTDLQGLIEAVLPSTAGETMDRRDRRNALAVRRASSKHIRTISMRMDHFRPQLAAGFPHASPLLEISPMRDPDLPDCHPGPAQRSEESGHIVLPGGHGHDRDLMTANVQALGQAVDNSLQASNGARGEELNNLHGSQSRGEDDERHGRHVPSGTSETQE
jgi:hypothetical protein